MRKHTRNVLEAESQLSTRREDGFVCRNSSLATYILFAQYACVFNAVEEIQVHFVTINIVEFAVQVFHQSFEVFDGRALLVSRAASVFPFFRCFFNAP